MTVFNIDPKDILNLVLRKEIPALSGTLNSITNCLAHKHTSAAERTNQLCELIQADPVLTTRVLRLVNSSMYAPFGRNITCIRKALSILGESALLNLLGQIPSMNTNALELARGFRKEYLKCAASASLSEEFAQATIGESETSTARIAGGLSRYMCVGLAYLYPSEWADIELQLRMGVSLENAVMSCGFDFDTLLSVFARELNQIAPFSKEIKEIAQSASRLSDHIFENSLTDQLVDDFAQSFGLSASDVTKIVKTAKDKALKDLNIDRKTAMQDPYIEDNKLLIGLTKLKTDLCERFEELTALDITRELMTGLSSSFSASRSILFIKKPLSYNAIMGLNGSNAMSKDMLEHFNFSIDNYGHALNACLAPKTIYRTDAPVQSMFPAFWKHLSTAQEVMLIPLLDVNEHGAFAVGVIYMDWTTKDGTGLSLEPHAVYEALMELGKILFLKINQVRQAKSASAAG